MKGYHKNEAATKESLTDDGFFKTGDLGRYDPDRGLFVTDRIKELIKVFILNILSENYLIYIFIRCPDYRAQLIQFWIKLITLLRLIHLKQLNITKSIFLLIKSMYKHKSNNSSRIFKTRTLVYSQYSRTHTHTHGYTHSHTLIYFISTAIDTTLIYVYI